MLLRNKYLTFPGGKATSHSISCSDPTAGAELAAAVARAGGLGLIGAAACSPEQLTEQFHKARALLAPGADAQHTGLGLGLINVFTKPELLQVRPMFATKPGMGQCLLILKLSMSMSHSSLLHSCFSRWHAFLMLDLSLILDTFGNRTVYWCPL
jgi:hypothetical protein